MYVCLYVCMYVCMIFTPHTCIMSLILLWWRLWLLLSLNNDCYYYCGVYFHVKQKVSLSFYHYICPISLNVNDIFRHHSHDGDFMGTMRDLFMGITWEYTSTGDKVSTAPKLTPTKRFYWTNNHCNDESETSTSEWGDQPSWGWLDTQKHKVPTNGHRKNWQTNALFFENLIVRHDI